MRPRRPPMIAAALAALALMAGVSACGDDEEAGDGAAPEGGAAELDLTVGDLVPLTGDLSDFGPPGRKAADLASEQIQTAIDEVGADHTFRVVHADTQTDPQASVQAARKLVGADNATCLAGAWASADTIPVGRSVSTREGVLQISPASTSDEITGLTDRGLINRTTPPDSFQGPALAEAMAQTLDSAEGKIVNIGARNDAYGTGLADTFTEAWEASGGAIGERVIYDPEQPSYDSEAARIVAGDPDGWVIIDFPETFQKVGPALVRAGGWDPERTFVTDGLASGSLPEDVGRRATEGVRGTAPGVPDAAVSAQAFDELWERAGGPERQTFDAQNFDAVVLCYLAAVAAGSTDGADMAEVVRDISAPPGRQLTWEQLPEAIRALQDGQEIDYVGASGPIDMNDDGDPTAGVYDIFRYEDGDLNVVDEVPLPEPAEG
jgi:ABC-type branched-subunit amino acid transport system substrate-binding protein